MNITKTISTAGIGLAIIGGSMMAVNIASAHGNDKQSELVDRLSTELNVDSAKVQGVFDSLKEEHKAERDAKHAEHIVSLVENGTLTQEQAGALSAKFDELQTAREALKDQDLTHEEMREQMKEARSNFEAWAEEQGINLEDIRPEGQGEHKGRNGHHRGHYGAEEDLES